MKCREFRKQFEEWLEGKASGELPELLERHRAACPDCDALAERTLKAAALLRILPATSLEPSPGFYTRLHAHIREQEEQELRWAPMEAWARRLAWGLSVAILALATYLAWVPAIPAPQAPSVPWMETAAGSQNVLEPVRFADFDRNQVMVSLVAEEGR